MQVVPAYSPANAQAFSQAQSQHRAMSVLFTIGIHLLIGYVLAMSVGIVPMPQFVPHTDVVNVPPPNPEDPVEQPLEKANSHDYSLTFKGPHQPDILVRDDPPTNDKVVIQGGGDEIIDHVITPQVTAPRLVRSSEPLYPAVSRIKEEAGIVHVRVTITPYGTIGEVQIERSSGYPRLDEAALKAVREWRFAPAMRGKEAIVGSVIVPVRFELRRG